MGLCKSLDDFGGERFIRSSEKSGESMQKSCLGGSLSFFYREGRGGAKARWYYFAVKLKARIFDFMKQLHLILLLLLFTMNNA